MKKITLLITTALFFQFGFAQVNVDVPNAIQVESLPYTDPAVNVPNGAQEEGSTGCNFNVPSVVYKFEVILSGSVTVTLATPAGLSEPVMYYATTIDETDVLNLTVTDNLGAVGAGCFDNDPGADGTRTTVVNAGEIFFVLVANVGITDITFTGDAQLATLSVEDNNLIGVSVYPNPVKDELTVKLPPYVEVTDMKLFDVLGRDTNLTMVNNTIDTSALAKGIYIFSLETLNGSYTSRVVKQ